MRGVGLVSFRKRVELELLELCLPRNKFYGFGWESFLSNLPRGKKGKDIDRKEAGEAPGRGAREGQSQSWAPGCPHALHLPETSMGFLKFN